MPKEKEFTLKLSKQRKISHFNIERKRKGQSKTYVFLQNMIFLLITIHYESGRSGSLTLKYQKRVFKHPGHKLISS